MTGKGVPGRDVRDRWEECSACPGEAHCARPLRRHAAGRLGGSSMAGSLCEGLGRRKRQTRIGRRPLSGFSSTCVSRRRYSRRPPAGSTRQARLAGWPWPGRIAPGTARRARASSPRRRIRRGYRILEVHDSPVPGVPDTGEKQWVSPGCRSTDRPVAGSVVRWFGSSHQPASAGPGDDYWEYCPWLSS